MSLKVNFPKFLMLLFFLLLFNIAVISLGDNAQSRVTVVNRTTHYLHVFVDDEPYLYLSPNKSITHTADAKPTMLVNVIYSPGQGVTGSATKTINLYYESASSDCVCDEEGHDECVYSPQVGGSEKWEVKAEDLQ